MRFWQLDLHADLGTDRLSWRRLSVLLAHLPDESATRRQLIGHDFAAWGVTEHLLAAAVDVLQASNWQRGGGKGQRPKPLPRPKSRVERERREREHAEHEARVQRLRDERKKVIDGG